MMSEGSLRANTWLIACLSKELKSGSPFGVVLDEQLLVLFRDERGRPVALEDRCLHRNAPLSVGRVREGRLQCAYHGWTYDRTGAVGEAPAPAMVRTPRLRASRPPDHSPGCPAPQCAVREHRALRRASVRQHARGSARKTHCGMAKRARAGRTAARSGRAIRCGHSPLSAPCREPR